MATISSEEPQKQTDTETSISFRWTYIALPLAFLFISIVLAAVFYGMLPPELSYQLRDDSPAQAMGRTAVLAWTIIPQIIFTLLAFGIVRIAMVTTRYLQAESSVVPKILLFMGNMLAIPQIILAFAMLDIFLYNAYQIKLIPLWLFGCIVLVLGSIILGVFFIRTIREVRRQQGISLRE